MDQRTDSRSRAASGADHPCSGGPAPAGAAFMLRDRGFAVVRSGCPGRLRERLRASVFTGVEAGVRCLLDRPAVREAVDGLRNDLRRLGLLGEAAVAVQAIAFDKSATVNWKVPWHQDLQFPFACAVTAPGYARGGVKDGVPYARPPLAVLEGLLAVRLHLDRCDDTNGPLRVAPGTHRLGVLPSDQVADEVARHGAVTCLAEEGELVLMKPLTLHASSPAQCPGRRRVLHVVLYSGPPAGEPWHREV